MLHLKKKISMFIGLVLMIGLLAGCGGPAVKPL
ncbi:MAG: hypothetical protein JG777_2773 [Clostridia bacterium]|jgi:hypothetical protein|nr:hypothetical protein [Clostridia bacterium]